MPPVIPRHPALTTTSLTTLTLLAAVLSWPLATAPAATAQGYGRLYEPTRTPIVGTPFKIEGFLTSTVKRPVKLQRVGADGTVTTIARTRAGTSGKFVFRGVRLGSPQTLRALAPRFKGDLATAKVAIATEAVPVTVVRQSGRIAAVPGIVQPGASPADPEESGYVVAGFQPARVNRPVVLQKRSKGRWATVARARQDRSGHAAFPVAAGGTYRATTAPVGRVRATTTGTTTSKDWKPAFQDTFSGDALDLGVWADRPAEGAASQELRTCARVDPSVRSVGGGTLRLGIGLDPTRAGETCRYNTERYGPGTHAYLLNSQIDTRDSYSFTHGIAAARIKAQKPQGMHGGFWLLPSNGKTPGRPDLGTEIDVVENFGAGSLKGGIGAFVHSPGADGSNVALAADAPATAWFKARGTRWWSSFHVFSVEWTATEYLFRVDGREFWREPRNVSQSGEYLVLSMLTSDFELRRFTPDSLAASAEVDWVRVWDR